MQILHLKISHTFLLRSNSVQTLPEYLNGQRVCTKVERMKSKKSPIKIESRHKSLREFIGRENWERGERREERKRKKRNFSI